MKLRYILTAFIISGTVIAQPVPPKREFRAAWIATVTNLDWPLSPSSPPDVQKSQLVNLLDDLKESGINTVVFQIRPECDALYQSSIDPWSYWLTGFQGSPPNPFYDPLQFALDETHKRGMELHAWFNPYRAVRNASPTYPAAPSHVSVTHPEWIIYFPAAGGSSAIKILDPGEPNVRLYIASVVADVVRRYDVDGVHFDDYFYPYPPQQITNQDDTTFANHPNGFTNRGDWRRDNVNRLIRMVRDSIATIKPHVKLGMSPFGIWKNGVPPGITGLDAYNVIYCDPIGWLRLGIIDYLTPQLYWRIGGPQDYGTLMPWWADSTFFHGKHFYPGKIFGGTYTPSELPNQVRLDRANPKTRGSVFFRASMISSNTLGFSDTLKNNFYKYPSLHPVMAWKDTLRPNAAPGFRYDRIPGSSQAALVWGLPSPAADGDTGSRYAIYRFDHNPSLPGELDDPRNMLGISGARNYNHPVQPAVNQTYYYVVTTLDRNYNEASASNVLSLDPPITPSLLTVPSGSVVGDSATLGWTPNGLASHYGLQVATDSTFGSGFLVNESAYPDTFRGVSGFEGQRRYYWRTRSNNPSGTSAFTSAWWFQYGIPGTPQLNYPADFAVNLPLSFDMTWYPTGGAQTYHLQVATNITFATLIVNDSTLTDTSYALSGLSYFTVYHWRVKGRNTQYGDGLWSVNRRFRTEPSTTVSLDDALPTEFSLGQNYPNPFNPLTRIPYSVPFDQHVTIKLYDLLGREVAVLLDEEIPPGKYVALWDGTSSPSGTYFVVMHAGNFTAARKIVLVK